MKTLLYILCGLTLSSLALSGVKPDENIKEQAVEIIDDDDPFKITLLSDEDLKQLVDKSLQGDHDATYKVAMHYHSCGDVQKAMLWLKRGDKANHPHCTNELLLGRFDENRTDCNNLRTLYKEALERMDVNPGCLPVATSIIMYKYCKASNEGLSDPSMDDIGKVLEDIQAVTPSLEKHKEHKYAKYSTKTVAMVLKWIKRDLEKFRAKSNQATKPIKQKKVKKEAPPRELITAGAVNFKTLSSSSYYTHISWKVTLKNNTNRHLKCYVSLKVKDKDGFLLKNRISDDVILKPLEEKSVSDAIFFDNTELRGGIKGFPEVKNIKKAY